MPDEICNATFEVEEFDTSSGNYNRVKHPYRCERKVGHRGLHATNSGKSETYPSARIADELEADRQAQNKLLERVAVSLETLVKAKVL